MTQLLSVLWGLRTAPKRSTNRTPFFLVYGAEAVLPSDLLHNAPRVELFSKAEAEQARKDGVDLLEEEREMALIWRYCWMKRPGPTLHDHIHETCSTDV